MPQGTVKWFCATKGYGFISPEGGGKDIFVHYSDVVAEGYKSLDENDRVTFEVVDTNKGKKAQKVTKL